ncbi:cellobiose phosphorylase [Paenibacillus kribbensis]|uniref:cellobiose phosphorylase n=1 Tax=Paenibacillus kribbensis TaxID=172713 RepID=UPI000838376C|nr:cellobiose phosphorylase [Paenibacillus kribbensis]
MQRYYFDDQGRFVIENYAQAKPFSSFLPGIAGVQGIPLWAYYVNRGQGIASFGVEDKNGAIMEFFPANRSYSLVPLHSFRTFLKVKKQNKWIYAEPFSAVCPSEREQQKMLISRHMLEIHSSNPDSGLEIRVQYFTLPNESYAALVRKVEIVNHSAQELEVEALDGMPAVLPFGIDNAAYKELGHTLKSWMDVYNLKNSIPYYKVRGSTADTSEVHQIAAGHFMYSFVQQEGDIRLLSPIVDPSVIFGENTALTFPDRFIHTHVEALISQQPVTTNKVPCGFSGYTALLKAGTAINHCTIIGHVDDIQSINERISEIATIPYIERKMEEAKAVTEELTEDMVTRTSIPLFDEYCRQSYLDNLLRGGYPLLLDNGTESPFVYHVFSRKHGDLERDYNFFKLQAGYYSQGNGNFRDANQNRRNDVWFNPGVGDFNIRMFMSLIQPDGYNPLVVKGCSFQVRELEPLLEQVEAADHLSMRAFFQSSFTPGELIQHVIRHNIALKQTVETFVTEALKHSEQCYEADFGEGFWIDHWTYNTDLIESYLSIYPDKMEELLLATREYMYYDSPAWVQPRRSKYVQMMDGRIRQHGAIIESKEKEAQLGARDRDVHWVRTGHGSGEIYKSNLYEKLLSLAAVKLSTLDPEGLGIEMEAGKPGWNDSMNGLPGLFASGFSELCELQRLVKFLIHAQKKLSGDSVLRLPLEVARLIQQLELAVEEYYHDSDESEAGNERKDYGFWSRISDAREAYRETVRFGFEGTEALLALKDVLMFLLQAERKLQQGMGRALLIGEGIYPTFFYYEAREFEVREDEYGGKLVSIHSFERKDMPYFLEGPTRAMKVAGDIVNGRKLYRQIRQSALYDRKLGMYKVNESLAEQPFELGRSTAFTPGWLENESIFMHMEYKYLLECLRMGLYSEFFSDIKKALPPFMDAKVYGRSTLENSSFIASSANPDASLHGTGYIARLSGSTAEFIHMWLWMMTGGKPFGYDHSGLSLKLEPKLPGWLFTDTGELSFCFLGSCQVTYFNTDRKDTYAPDSTVTRYVLHYASGEKKTVDRAVLGQQEAQDVRSRLVSRIEVYLGK